MRHAPPSAPSVVIAPSSSVQKRQLHGEYEQVFQPLVALARCRHRGDRGPRLASCAAPGRSTTRACRGLKPDIYGDRELGSGFGADPRHRQEASVGIVAPEEGGYLRRDRDRSPPSSGDPAREQFTSPGPRRAMAAASGLASEEAVERTRGSSICRAPPRARERRRPRAWRRPPTRPRRGMP